MNSPNFVRSVFSSVLTGLQAKLHEHRRNLPNDASFLLDERLQCLTVSNSPPHDPEQIYDHNVQESIFFLSNKLLDVIGGYWLSQSLPTSVQMDMCSLFFLHEFLHIQQGLDSDTYRFARDIDEFVQSLDYGADAFSIDVLFTLSRSQSLHGRDRLSEIIQAAIHGGESFANLEEGRDPKQIHGNRMERQLTWHIQYCRTKAFPIEKELGALALRKPIRPALIKKYRGKDRNLCNLKKINSTEISEPLELQVLISNQKLIHHHMTIPYYVTMLRDGIFSGDGERTWQALRPFFREHPDFVYQPKITGRKKRTTISKTQIKKASQGNRKSIPEEKIRASEIFTIKKISNNGICESRTEYRNLSIVSPKVKLRKLPSRPSIKVESGHIELFEAGNLGSSGPLKTALIPVKGKWNLNFQEGEIDFGEVMSNSSSAWGCYYRYYAINAYPLSSYQFCQMNKDVKATPIDNTYVRTPNFSVDQLSLEIIFPKDFNPDPLSLQIFNEKNRTFKRCEELENRCRQGLITKEIENFKIVSFKVNDPPPLHRFSIFWRVPERKKRSDSFKKLSSERENNCLINGLLKIWPKKSSDLLWNKRWEERQKFANVCLGKFQELLNVFPNASEKFDCSIMVYDEKDFYLKVVCSSVPHSDKQSHFKLSYGNGIAGMVHKTGWARQFYKPHKPPTFEDGPLGYYPAHGRSEKSIHCEAMVSIPLHHEKQRDLIYGVLNIDSIIEDSALFEFIDRTRIFKKHSMNEFDQIDDEETKKEKLAIAELNLFIFKGLRKIVDMKL